MDPTIELYKFNKDANIRRTAYMMRDGRSPSRDSPFPMDVANTRCLYRVCLINYLRAMQTSLYCNRLMVEKLRGQYTAVGRSHGGFSIELIILYCLGKQLTSKQASRGVFCLLACLLASLEQIYAAQYHKVRCRWFAGSKVDEITLAKKTWWERYDRPRYLQSEIEDIIEVELEEDEIALEGDRDECAIESGEVFVCVVDVGASS